jgi:hypothetical protein
MKPEHRKELTNVELKQMGVDPNLVTRWVPR